MSSTARLRDFKNSNKISESVDCLTRMKNGGWASGMIKNYIFRSTTPEERDAMIRELRRILNE